MARTTVQKSTWEGDDGIERVQYSITIPKNLAEALDLNQGDRMNWKIASGESLRMVKDND